MKAARMQIVAINPDEVPRIFFTVSGFLKRSGNKIMTDDIPKKVIIENKFII